jgi:glycine betaine/proline transport system ATP-binding protein
VVISARRLWKFFGPETEQHIRALGSSPSPEELDRLPLIAGIRDLSLDVHDGEVFVVMGLSGSGKSTLIRCLTGLYAPSFGDITVEGRTLSRIAKDELIAVRRKTMGMVFQNFALLPHLTALDNVAFPLRVQGVAAAERRRRALEMLDLVGLTGMDGRYPGELSGGQQQRVGIARSLATNPHLWFLDEPFSALDPLIRFDMQTELQRLQKMLRKTIVFITHDFDEAVRLADRIAIMRDGRLIQIGTADDLVLRPADAEVARFVERIPKHKVLRASAFCEPTTTALPPDAPTVRYDVPVAATLSTMLGTQGPIAVLGETGEVLGALKREDVIKVMSE